VCSESEREEEEENLKHVVLSCFVLLYVPQGLFVFEERILFRIARELEAKTRFDVYK
jgi:hypothetical protein